MSPRVTRSSARLSAGSSNSTPAQPPAPPSRPLSTVSRKRKAPARDPSPEQPAELVEAPQSRGRSKRTRIEVPEPPLSPAPAASTRLRKGKATSAMSSAGWVFSFQTTSSANAPRPSAGPSEEKSAPQAPSGPSSSANKRRSSRKKDNQGKNPRYLTSSNRLLTVCRSSSFCNSLIL